MSRTAPPLDGCMIHKRLNVEQLVGRHSERGKAIRRAVSWRCDEETPSSSSTECPFWVRDTSSGKVSDLLNYDGSAIAQTPHTPVNMVSHMVREHSYTQPMAKWDISNAGGW